MDLHINIALFFFIFRIPNIVAPESQNLVMEFVGSDKTSEHTG